MLRHGVFIVFVLLLSLSLAASCSSINSGLEPSPAETEVVSSDVSENLSFSGFPEFPVDSASKDVSWIGTVMPDAPFLEHRTYPSSLHPNGLVLEGLHTMPVTYLPPPPYFAYAIYQVPLGVHESDLLSITFTGDMEAAGQSYFVAIANFDALMWQWYGPGGSTSEYSIDVTTLGYDLTGAWGNMYFAVAVPQAMLLELESIELEFDGYEPGAGPTYWNVWGMAYDDYAMSTVLPGETVTFEDTLTATVFSTPTGADGGWGTNLPDGFYKFNVTNNDWLFDPTSMYIIEDLDAILEVNAGSIIYHGTNAAYDGNVLPMPIITVNVY